MSTAQKFHALRQVVRELVRRGAEVRFWTDNKFRRDVEADGATFVDLFDPITLDAADDASRPVPSRYITFAALRAGDVAASAKAWGAELVVFDSFTVLGEAVARRLEIPWVPVSSAHLVDSEILRKRLADDPRVMTDPRCLAAVSTLQNDFMMTNVTRFSQFFDPSPWLNVVCEPEEWVGPHERARYQPLACFGKLSSEALEVPFQARTGNSPLRIYASFGTVIWWYWAAQAAAAFEVIAEAARELGAELIIGLGGGHLPNGSRERLVAAGATVHDFADQPKELARSDIFITHHGSTSSHEAIAARVPMLSFPFSGDQPDVARVCQRLGFALPLIDGLAREEIGPLDVSRVTSALKEVVSRRKEMLAAIEQARVWEFTALSRRPEVAQRILSIR